MCEWLCEWVNALWVRARVCTCLSRLWRFFSYKKKIAVVVVAVTVVVIVVCSSADGNSYFSSCAIFMSANSLGSTRVWVDLVLFRRHTCTHRHEPHSHQVDIVSSSSSLLSLARRFHLINCVYKKEMNCHAQQQQQLVVYACVCVRASNGWRSFGAALNHIGCASVCFTVCVCLAYTSVPVCVSVFVCMWAFSSLAFLRARTQFSSRLSCPSSLTLKYAFLCVRVCERVRSSGIGSFQMQFRLPWAFRLIIKLPLPPPLLLFLFFSYFFFSFFFSVFLLLLFAWWVETSQRSLLRPVGLSHSLTPSFSPCLCLCVSSCAWADLNFMVSSILPSCNIKLN